jgi:hypothetical protein
LVQIGELSSGILAGSRASDARGDLFPISHILSRIVSADDRNGQETPRPSSRQNLALRHVFPVFD